MANIANIGLDDEVLKVWEDMKYENKTRYKALCFKLSNKGDKVCRDEEFDLLLADPKDVPDEGDYDARRPYEEKLFTDYMSRVVADPDSVRFIAYYFYYRTTAQSCKQKLGMMCWVSDNCCKAKLKMCGASAKEMIIGRLDGLSGTNVMLKDASEVDYDDFCKRISQNLKN